MIKGRRKTGNVSTADVEPRYRWFRWQDDILTKHGVQNRFFFHFFDHFVSLFAGFFLNFPQKRRLEREQSEEIKEHEEKTMEESGQTVKGWRDGLGTHTSTARLAGVFFFCLFEATALCVRSFYSTKFSVSFLPMALKRFIFSFFFQNVYSISKSFSLRPFSSFYSRCNDERWLHAIFSFQRAHQEIFLFGNFSAPRCHIIVLFFLAVLSMIWRSNPSRKRAKEWMKF